MLRAQLARGCVAATLTSLGCVRRPLCVLGGLSGAARSTEAVLMQRTARLSLRRRGNTLPPLNLTRGKLQTLLRCVCDADGGRCAGACARLRALAGLHESSGVTLAHRSYQSRAGAVSGPHGEVWVGRELVLDVRDRHGWRQFVSRYDVTKRRACIKQPARSRQARWYRHTTGAQQQRRCR